MSRHDSLRMTLYDLLLMNVYNLLFMTHYDLSYMYGSFAIYLMQLFIMIYFLILHILSVKAPSDSFSHNDLFVRILYTIHFLLVLFLMTS